MTVRIARVALGFVICAIFAAACAQLPRTTPSANYQLQAASRISPEPAADASGRRPVVAVERPIATGAMATDRIVVEVGGELQFVSGAKWEDEMPDLLALQMARALQRAGQVDVVDAAQKGGRAGFALVTVLQQMQVEIGPTLAGEAQTSIGARLVSLPNRDVVATGVFEGAAPAANDSPAALTAAINEATAEALSDLSGWVASQTGAGAG